MTDAGVALLDGIGIDLDSIVARRSKRSGRLLCRPCLDWSERRYHLAGHVGTELCRRCLELGWLVRERDSRAVKITPAGRTGLHRAFDLDLNQHNGVLLLDRL